MSVRKVVTRTGRGMRCLVPSRKMGRMIQCESMLEADAVSLFEWSPDIVKFEEQPNFEYPNDGTKPFKYTPDFRLFLIDGTDAYVEVKPERKLQGPTLRQRLSHIAEHFERSGRKFHILTDVAIRTKALRSNLRQLTYHARPLPTDLRFWETFEKFIRCDSLTLGSAHAAFNDPRLVLRLLSNRKLAFDIEQPLSNETPLFVPDQECVHDAFLL